MQSQNIGMGGQKLKQNTDRQAGMQMGMGTI